MTRRAPPALVSKPRGDVSGQADRRGIKVHPAAAMFPLLADTAPDDLRELADDIKKNGIQQPLVFWTPTPIGRAIKEKSLLDGRNRLDALEMAFGDDPELFTEKLED